jgi:transaldolase
VLWASTSTKDPVLSDIKYITELIGNGTVNTVPDSTLQAFIDHGEAQVILTGNDDSADKILSALKSEGIDVDAVCRKLLADGLDAFKRSFASLIGSLEEKSRDLTAAGK